MSDGTYTHAVVHAPRREWRDWLKRDERLTAHAVLVGLLVADYWRKDSTDPLWVVNDRLIDESRLSRAAVYRALAELRAAGYLHEVERARHGRSPRWIARQPFPHQSLSETDSSPTETDRSLVETRDSTHTSGSWEGASGQMWTSESPRSAPPRDHESGPFPADPRDTKERKDYLLLARHMSNFTEADVAKVYGWLREGGDRRRPMKWPGGFARRNHALPTSEDDCSQWQGYFRRFFQQGQKRSALPHVREERARGSRAA